MKTIEIEVTLLAMNLDPSRTKDRILLCLLCTECRYWYSRAERHSAAAAAYEPSKAIWKSLQPERARILAQRAAFRLSILRGICYDRYTAAANKFVAEYATSAKQS